MQLIMIMGLSGVLIVCAAQYMHHADSAQVTVHYIIKYEQYHQLIMALLTYAHVLLHENKTMLGEINEKKELILKVQPWPSCILIKGVIRYTMHNATSVEVVGQLYEHDVVCYEQKMMLNIQKTKPLCTTSILLPR